MDLEVRDLRLVDAVAAHESITGAGRVLHLTQSAISRQLLNLERRLDTRLFTRAGRRMLLTPSGQRLLEASRALLASLSRAEDEVRAVGRDASHILRVSTECYTAYHWVPAVFRSFRRLYPDIEVQLHAEATGHALQALLRGELDVAIVSSLPRPTRVETIPLLRDELVAVVPKDHDWARRRFVTARDFVDQHVLMYAIDREESTLFHDVLVPARVEPRRVSRVQLTEGIVELVKAGVGVGLLARWAVAPHVAAGTLATVRVTERGLPRRWSAAFLRDAPLRDRWIAFARLLGRELVSRSSAELTELPHHSARRRRQPRGA